MLHYPIPESPDTESVPFRLLEWQSDAAEAALQAWEDASAWVVLLSAMAGLGKTAAGWQCLKRSGRKLVFFASPTAQLARQASKDGQALGLAVHVVSHQDTQLHLKTLDDIDALAARASDSIAVSNSPIARSNSPPTAPLAAPRRARGSRPR